MESRGAELPRDWGVLLSLTIPANRTIKGRVLLNKTMAMLQCDGFPIKNRFVNAEMGPYDRAIKWDAEHLSKNHLITIDEEPIPGKEDRCIYRMRDEGLNFYLDKYQTTVENLPYRRVFEIRREAVQRMIETYFTRGFVDRVHRDFFMLTPEQLGEKAESSIVALREQFSKIEKKWDRRCPICLEILGSMEFAILSLEHVIEEHLEDEHSGKNMIVYNTMDLFNWTSQLESHAHIADIRLNDDQVSRLREYIRHRLYCLEQIGERYNIINPIMEEGMVRNDALETSQ